ncbi:SRPBCC family protein [Brevibacillus nitrificans]|uniref:SRPBCC family protein n=1 Tax=Brevibacillus nitrificans TaxID=651560 RepID=A0A3M8DF39_9BACL|nr:SRPBCC family protein [Brevibacillus nitrificans]MED1791944.1 SRPBCC family protein [Brevibacillus nitrificans]RNB86634.1 SRPBCC family protein [Brevibacillus nitrificans]
MPQGLHEIELDLSISTIWEFVSVMDNWIPLVPGYISHEIIHARQSTWTFSGDIGIMKKKIQLQVDITDWIQPTLVRFTLTGLNENFAGDGYFQAQALSPNRTKMTGFLDITAKGVKAPMVNAFLKTSIPELTQELTEAVANRMKELASIPPHT